MREMEKEMQIAQDQIAARREEQERSIHSVRRLECSTIISYSVYLALQTVGWQYRDDADNMVEENSSIFSLH